MGPRLTITLDCNDPARLAQFWSEALGYEDGGRHDEFWPLLPPDDTEPMLVLQEVTEPKVAKSRMHLDVHVEDLAAEVVRLEDLGAHRVDPDPVEGHGHVWYVMADPEGNEFCVVKRPG
ncbi:MAG: VOC family protein [Actinobacteria bacterium]|nr:VOC family protein [Actinomycetota bacterium]